MDMLSSNNVLLLDGGLSNELENSKISFNVHNEPLWTAKALHTDPDAVVATHMAYLQAGADIIETASYQATLEGFKDFMSLKKEDAEKLIESSSDLAKTAVEKFRSLEGNQNKPKLVAGSIGPYGVYLRDGSEYTGKYMKIVKKEDLESMHLPRIMAIVRGKPDLIAIETMPSLEEVKIILELLKTHSPSTKAWVSFSVKDHDPSFTAFGDSMELAFKTVANFEQVIAVGINCCRPKEVTDFLKLVKEYKARGNDRAKQVKIIVYPNSGQEWIRGKGWIKDPVPLLESYIKDWMNSGANIIGGCCQVGCDQIAKMRLIIDEWNRSL